MEGSVEETEKKDESIHIRETVINSLDQVCFRNHVKHALTYPNSKRSKRSQASY